MNAATRVHSSSIYIGRRAAARRFSWVSWVTPLLLISVFLSAFAVVYARDYQRQLVTDIQGLQMDYDNMVTQRSQLLLEQAAFSTQTRVQQIATQKLGMVYPQQQAIITVG